MRRAPGLEESYTVANPKFVESFTTDERKAFLAACSEADEHLRQYTQKDEAEAYEFLKAQGMQVNLNVDVESFRVACTPVIEKLPDLFPPDLVKLAQGSAA
jgi:TRAP-type C4-dicarboxylate transport system substrate-binding protein